MEINKVIIYSMLARLEAGNALILKLLADQEAKASGEDPDQIFSRYIKHSHAAAEALYARIKVLDQNASGDDEISDTTIDDILK